MIWLRGRGGGKFSAFWLDGWPRVTSVDAADFNGDGKNDLAVAAFGWRKTGRSPSSRTRTAGAAQPDFTTHTIDPRTGSIDIVPVDLNRDGKMDFITLLAQEHETVVAYLNKGETSRSSRSVIYAAPHPNWGSSGIQVADLDGDGDIDVLLTHGDTFDDGIVKPYHGIQWLENTAAYPFVEHTLAQMPGVHAVAAGGSRRRRRPRHRRRRAAGRRHPTWTRRLPALVWLEQTKPGVFVRHTIEMGFPRHATLDVGDIDGDGAADIVVGRFFLGDTRSDAWLDVWINPLKKLPPERRER